MTDFSYPILYFNSRILYIATLPPLPPPSLTLRRKNVFRFEAICMNYILIFLFTVTEKFNI